MNSLFSWLITSDYVKAQILAFARHLVTTLGAGMIAHGYANSGMVESASGFVCLTISFYLSQRDVKGVDKKIEVALNTPSPLATPTPTGLTKEQEEKETELLNELQAIKPGASK